MAAAGTAALGGCGRGVPKDAVAGAEELFAAVVARDRVAFEAAVDRRAVREDLHGQLVAVAKAQGLEVDGGPSEFALDRMIGPDAFRLVDAQGQAVSAPPTAEQLAEIMKVEQKGRVCVQDAQDRCLLAFARQKGDDGAHWRLVSMPAEDLTIALPPAGKGTPGATARRAQGQAREG
jgi:hypothetical protein